MSNVYSDFSIVCGLVNLRPFLGCDVCHWQKRAIDVIASMCIHILEPYERRYLVYERACTPLLLYFAFWHPTVLVQTNIVSWKDDQSGCKQIKGLQICYHLILLLSHAATVRTLWKTNHPPIKEDCASVNFVLHALLQRHLPHYSFRRRSRTFPSKYWHSGPSLACT